MSADVSEYEWKHLQPGEYINDVVVDILLREISTATDKLYCPSSHIFQLLKKFSIKQLLPWLPPDTSKPWVIPTCDNHHWALVIIDFANKSVTQLDTLYEDETRAHTIRHHIKQIYPADYSIHLHQPIIQSNGYDCGLVCIDIVDQLATKEVVTWQRLSRRDLCKRLLHDIQTKGKFVE